jgi:hypothetical protein
MHVSNVLGSNVAEFDPATVVAQSADGTFLAEHAGHRISCRRAASCLLQPEIGDQVLIFNTGNGSRYLLAVLERASLGTAHLNCTGDVLLSSSGSLRLAASQDIALDSCGFALRADDAQVTLERLRFSGVLWQGAVSSLRLVGHACETIMDRITQLTKVSLRRVEQIDQLRAGQIDYEGSSRVRIRSKYTAITATHVLKVKGRQVHIG